MPSQAEPSVICGPGNFVYCPRTAIAVAAQVVVVAMVVVAAAAVVAV